MDDLQSFPTFQWSAFPHGKDGEQVVVRGNDLEQFVLNIEAVKKEFGEPTMSRTAERLVQKVENHAKVCPVCGSETVFTETKTGKKIEKCSTAGWDAVNKVATGCSYIKWL